MAKRPARTSSPGRKTSNRQKYVPAVYISSISLENIRCFGPKQTLDLTGNKNFPAQWTIILGDNGTGKTTLLQAISWMRPVENRYQTGKGKSTSRLGDMPNFNDMRRAAHQDNSKCDIDCKFIYGSKLNASHKKSARSTLSLHWQYLDNYINSPGNHRPAVVTRVGTSKSSEILNLICLGYGAGRKLSASSLSEAEDDTTKSLFNEFANLRNAEEWLLQADYAASRKSQNSKSAIAELKKVKSLLTQLLPDVSDIRFQEYGGSPNIPSVEFKTPYGWIPLKELGLGYKTLITWMVDFASRMFESYPNSKNPLEEAAVVLIDEIDLHLHPKWQRSIMSYLSELFPNTQFIATAHSPLVVQAATDANIAVLRREGDHVVIDQSVSAIRGWRIDQVLTSDLFGLESARPPELEQQLKERTDILSKSRLTKKDRARVTELEEEIGDLPTGERKEDIEAMEIIRRAAASMK